MTDEKNCDCVCRIAVDGYSNEEKKEPAETSNETVIQTEDKTAAATKEGAIEGQNKDAGTTAEAVKEPKKKPPIEGC